MEMATSVKVCDSVMSDTVKISRVGEFLIELCHPVLQIQNLFQTKTSHFPHPFSDLTSESCNLFVNRLGRPVKSPGLLQKTDTGCSFAFKCTWR